MQKKGIKIKGSPLLCQILFKFLLCFWRIMVPIWNGNFSLLHFFQPITWQPTSLRLNAVISLVKNMQKVKISITWASHGAPSWSFFDNKKFCLVSNRKRKFKWVYFYQFGLLLFQFENSIFQCLTKQGSFDCWHSRRLGSGVPPNFWQESANSCSLKSNNSQFSCSLP